MPDYVKTMSRLQNEDLLRIIHSKPTDYEAEAVKAAQNEIDRRGISEAVMREIDLQVAQESAEELLRPQEQLTNAEMVGFLLFGPILIVSMPLAVMLGAKGYSQKARGAFGAIMLSFPIYLVLFGIFVFVIWLFGF